MLGGFGVLGKMRWWSCKHDVSAVTLCGLQVEGLRARLGIGD